MEREALRQKLRDALAKVAPELKGEPVNDAINLQDQLDLDSVDLLNYIIQIQKDLQIEIPNQDFQKFLRMDDTILYLSKKLEAPADVHVASEDKGGIHP
jgi:acyl carrier protein